MCGPRYFTPAEERHAQARRLRRPASRLRGLTAPLGRVFGIDAIDAEPCPATQLGKGPNRTLSVRSNPTFYMYGDESEALTHPYLARAWAKSGAGLRVPAPGQPRKVAMLGSLDHVTRHLIVHTSPTKRSSDFVAHLQQLDEAYGPKPGQPAKLVVLVEDNGPIHTSKLSRAARAHWLAVESLSKYAPELNDIEPVWRDLKAYHLAHQTFKDIDALDRAIHVRNQQRKPLPLAKQRMPA